MLLTRHDREWIEAEAKRAGFDLAGLASVPDPESESAQAEAQHFADWIASGAAGDMDWLKRTDASGALVRGDLRRSVPWARSVLVCAVNYNAEAPRSIDPAAADAGWIARYAWSGRGSAEMAPGDVPGSDYHEELLPRLKIVADRLREHFGDACQTRAYVDTGPILERGYAARAGIGWIGRNTCVLNQQQGSWILLGVVITSLEPEPEAWPIPAVDRCGSCTRCVDACPTDALHGSGLAGRSRQMDASRCIAYLTIEKKGSIDPDLREGMGRQVFGCDICQDVCPWNGRAPVGRSGMLQPRLELVNPSLAWLASMDGPEFNRRFRGSPLERTRRKRILRNVANAMGNSKDQQFRPQLEAWTKNEDPVLVEAAQWALDRLTGQLKPIAEEQADRLQSAFAGPLDQ
ncbi:MAG: tRNA epoxyqueuosine(34) reductase QueG [Janthinobacterium lividum]